MFNANPADDKFQYRIDEIFKVLPNVFGIADDILIIGYDGDVKDQDRMLRCAMQICHKEKLLLKINFISDIQVFPSSVRSYPDNVQPDHHKLCTLTNMACPINKKEL